MIHGTLKHFLEDMLDIAGYAKKEKETYVVSLENTLREAVAIELLKKFPKDDACRFKCLFRKWKLTNVHTNRHKSSSLGLFQARIKYEG